MKRNENLIRDALAHNLSGLQMTPSHRARILERIQEGKKVKKKMPLALVLAIVLALISVTALALSNWEAIKDYLSVARQISRETYDWNTEDKIRLVNAMHAAGIEMDEGTYRKLSDDTLMMEDKDAACVAILTARYGKNWMDSIEDTEWPLEIRKQSEENMREYDMWNDAWQRQHSGGPKRTQSMTEAEAREVLYDGLSRIGGFYAEADLPEEQLTLTYLEDERMWDLAYTVNEAWPGEYIPDYFSEKYGEKKTTALAYLQARYGDQKFFTIHVYTDPYGEEMRFQLADMKTLMVENMQSDLTEIYSFKNGSWDESLIRVTHYPEYGVWEAAYTITDENPGLYDWMPEEIEYGQNVADTVLDYRRYTDGVQYESYTFRCLYDENNRYLGVHDLEEYLADRKHIDYQRTVNEGAAVLAAKKALAAKYPVAESELDAMKVVVHQERSGAEELEYVIAFFGYRYSEDLTRLWEYRARVDANDGRVTLAVSREDSGGAVPDAMRDSAAP